MAMNLGKGQRARFTGRVQPSAPSQAARRALDAKHMAGKHIRGLKKGC
jgi:hypothetical protein